MPSANTLNLAERLPNSELVPLYPGAGHGGIFPNHVLALRLRAGLPGTTPLGAG